MSDRQASMRGWVAHAGLLLTILGVLVTVSMKAGEVLHEMKALREQLTEDRSETRNAIKDLSVHHRDLERRVEVLEVHDSKYFQNYKAAQ